MTIDWIELIKALTPIIIALLQPHLQGVAHSTASMIVEAEKTDLNGPDKLNMVVNDILPLAAKINPDKTVGEVKNDLVNGIDASIAAANVVQRINDF